MSRVSKTSKKSRITKKTLLNEQQKRVAAVFPSGSNLTLEQRITRLEACTATYLAFMDRVLDYWERNECMFTAAHPSKIIKPESQPATTTTAGQQPKPGSPYI